MIGIFDSGLGGLTIMKEIKRILPNYDYLYFGDTLHVPYGNRSDEAVFNLTKSACDYLFSRGAQLIILACNTASSRALRKLQQEYLPKKRKELKNDNINILGVIRSLVEEAAVSEAKKVGVIGTRGTINSNAYVIELGKLNDRIRVFQRACPLLVPLIEENWLNRKETTSILRYYLREFKRIQLDRLILGCTHYPIVLKEIRSIVGRGCVVPNPSEVVARSLADYLKRHAEIEKQLSKNSKAEYVVTDLTENFKMMAQRFLGEGINIQLYDANKQLINMIAT